MTGLDDTIQPSDPDAVDAGSDDGLGARRNRRAFFAVGGASAAAVLAACGDDDDDSSTATTTPAAAATTAGTSGATTTAGADTTDAAATTTEGTTATTKPPTTTAAAATTTAAGGAGGDLDIGAFAASLEVLAVNTYGAALAAAGSGALGEVPPAVATFVTTAQGHHQAALDAWNSVLTGAGRAAVTSPPADLEATVNQQFGQVTDVNGAAALALMLEQIAAATYLEVIPKLTTPDAILLAGSIQVIDMQHAAVLLFVAGQYPVPDVFAKVDMSVAPV